ncbi:ATP synthase subunit b, mitochondrial-like [Pieris rapae]|uniref:ATP synthase subunit b, mitochondrial-like n=1 Tax=Pieris rapae TaxID=64459 RepID=UPI001E27EC2B|nr:ATP synthase subunit b, mitochondrial-like [Pieris rapae]
MSMILNKILKLGSSVLESRIVFAHTKTCPASKKPVCPPAAVSQQGDVTGLTGSTGLKRGEPGKVRMGMFPEEWFTFFHSKTGVSGPYVFGILVTNYLVSKEIFIMEHEYYAGLSIFVMVVGGVKLLGRNLANYLDSQIEAVEKELDQGLKNQMNMFETVIKDSKDMQMRAVGQKMLLDAKKENVAMQLEAAYRERLRIVFTAVKGRMDYHVKRTRVENRIHQKWMIDWILNNVRKSITPDFEKQALNRAIEDIAAMAGKA